MFSLVYYHLKLRVIGFLLAQNELFIATWRAGPLPKLPGRVRGLEKKTVYNYIMTPCDTKKNYFNKLTK